MLAQYKSTIEQKTFEYKDLLAKHEAHIDALVRSGPIRTTTVYRHSVKFSVCMTSLLICFVQAYI